MENPRDIMNDVGSTARKTANEFKGDVKSAAGDIRSSAREAKNTLRDELTERYADFREQAKEAVSQSESFVKEHPLSTVLGACAVGFIAGALLGRSSRH